MKRFTSILLILILCAACLAGCNKASNDTTPTTTAETTAPVITFESTPDEQQVADLLSAVVDVEKYDMVEDSDTVTTYTSKEKSAATITGDLKIDGKALPMPYSYADLTNIGFNLNGDTSHNLEPREKFDTIYNYYYSYCTFSNSQGLSVGAILCNPTDKQITIVDGKGGYSVTFDKKTCPDFSISGINKNSTLEEITGKLGAPYQASFFYNEQDQTAEIQYTYSDAKTGSTIIVTTDGNNTVKCVIYTTNKGYH